MKQYVSKFSGKELDERLTRVDNIPTKTSELNNDSGFISEADADNKYTDKNKTDVLERDIKDLKDRIDVEIPTKVSQLENDKNYITNLDIQNKADLENGKIITSQLPDYLLGQVMFGGLIYSNNSVIPTINFDAKYGPFSSQYVIIGIYEYYKYEGVYFIAHESGTILDIDVKVGDWIVSTGSSWEKIDNTDAVTSVAGLVGNVNASSLAAALAGITDSNALARKTDLPKKLSELEADIQVGGTPNWNINDVTSPDYIYNRTHYVLENSTVGNYSLDSKVEGDIIVTDLVVGNSYQIWNFNGTQSISFVFIKGSEFILPVGPSIKVVCDIVDGLGCLKLVTSTYGYNDIITIASINVKQLDDAFIPDNIVRKAELPKKLSDLEADIEIGGDTEYESAIADKTLTTPNAVGGIAKGTKVSDLEGKTFAEMFDDLLFPTVNPTFTAPTASIAFKSYSSTQEVGATGPTSANFTTGYNAGEIKLNGVKQANRGGTLNSANSFIYVNGSSSNKTLPTKVTLGSTTFKYRAAYNQGPQPKNNKGGNYDSPLAAGTVDSSQITLNGTYPWYASTSAATSTNPVVKQSLVAWNATAGKMTTGQFTVQPSGTLPQVFKLPRKIDVLQLKNALNGNMENVEEINGVPKDYTESTETINIGGTNVTYYVYTYSGSTRGSVTLLAKF